MCTPGKSGRNGETGKTGRPGEWQCQIVGCKWNEQWAVRTVLLSLSLGKSLSLPEDNVHGELGGLWCLFHLRSELSDNSGECGDRRGRGTRSQDFCVALETSHPSEAFCLCGSRLLGQTPSSGNSQMIQHPCLVKRGH